MIQKNYLQNVVIGKEITGAIDDKDVDEEEDVICKLLYKLTTIGIVFM